MAERFDRFTAHSRKALQLAQEEAHRLKHNYLGTEHLLLGLLRQREGAHATILRNLGVDLDTARGAVEFIVGRGERIETGEIGLTPRAKKVIEFAVDEARQLQHHYIGPEHLLLGLVREGEGMASGILESLGVRLEEVRTRIAEVVSEPGGQPEVRGYPRLRSPPFPPIRRPAATRRTASSRASVDPWRAFVGQVEAASTQSLLDELQKVTEEIAYRRFSSGPGYECGVVRFLPRAGEPSQVTHEDKDVLCYVLQGQGRLRIGENIREVLPGDLFRIPARTPHDFSAGDEPLVLVYVSITVSEPPAE